MGDKKFYWLKLKRDFFKRHDIRIIESMPNGKDYILFYLKLLCESVDHEGNLRFSEQIPYNEDMLATITDTNVDVVRSSIKIFTQLEMMEILDDGTYFMNEVQKMIGSAADNDNANRQRRFREKQKELALPDRYESVTKNNESKSIEIEKDIDIEIETEIETEKEKDKRDGIGPSGIVALFHTHCPSYPKVKVISQARNKAIRARMKVYSKGQFVEMFKKAEASSFLKGANDRNWSANFDWLMKDSNFAKVLDGNYDDRGMPQNRMASELDNAYAMMHEWAESEG